MTICLIALGVSVLKIKQEVDTIRNEDGDNGVVWMCEAWKSKCHFLHYTCVGGSPEHHFGSASVVSEPGCYRNIGWINDMSNSLPSYS